MENFVIKLNFVSWSIYFYIVLLSELLYMYLPDPQTRKRNRAKSQGPTEDPSSCDFYRIEKILIDLTQLNVNINKQMEHIHKYCNIEL